MTERPVRTSYAIWLECFHDTTGQPDMCFTTFKRKTLPRMAKAGVAFKEPHGKARTLQWRCYPSRVISWRENGGLSK